MTEATQAQETPQAQTIVTGETLQAFQLDRLGMSEKTQEPIIPEKTAPEIVPEKSEEEVIPEDGTMEGGKVVFRGKWVDKKDVGYRMHLKTEAVKAEKARADALEARIRELEAGQKKEEKPESKGKPTPDQYTDLDKYAEALEKYGREQALIEREAAEKKAKAEADQERVMKAWNKQLDKARKEIEDYDEVLESSPVKTNDFSAEMQAAIVESEVGAQLLYHFAQNPEIVEKMKGMTLTAALREIGKFEVKFEKSGEKSQETQPAKPPVQKSNAPAPIKPVGTVNAGKTSDTYFDENGEFTGTPAEYRQLRREGKIK